MTSDLQPTQRPIDRNAVVSFVTGLMALLAVCIAIIPVPLTGYLCFPGAAILTVVTAAHGVRALKRFKTLSTAEKGMTITGMAAGIAGLLITAFCAVVVLVLGLRLVEALRQWAH